MENFKRSLKYLWPYRRRLAMAIVCVVLIAVLWGGGLAALVPAMEVLTSKEGLHGWIFNSAVQRQLGVRVVSLPVPPGTTVLDGAVERPVSHVLNVTAVGKGRPAEGRLNPNDWLVGLSGKKAEPLLLRGAALARHIATDRTRRPVSLWVYNPYQRSTRMVTLDRREGAWYSRWFNRFLIRVAETIPEPATKRDRFGILLWLLAFVVAATLLRNLLRFLQEYLVGSAVWRGMVDLRCHNYDVVLRLPTTFFSEKGVTDAMSRFLQDTAQLARGQETLFGRALVEPAKAVGALVAAMWISPRLTLLAMVAGPPAFLLIRAFSRTMRRASSRALQSWSGMLAVLAETLTGIRVVKAYTMEGVERRRFFRVNRALLKQQKKMVRTLAATSPTVEALGITAAMGAVAVAGYWVFTDVMRTGDFLALMACLAALFDPVRKLAKVPARIHRAEAAAARLFELQDQKQERYARTAPPLPRHCESISFRDVTFSYPGTAQPALKGINLELRAGETLAIVGPNGSGKTTLVSLIPRLLEPSGGVIRIDGRDIQEYSLRSLRRQIALVTQEAVVFNASIADNIAYGKRRAGRDEIESAARQAYVDEFVAELPNGYDAVVGEYGATLSGGQRQRVAIARAILRDPAILIFDEAMSQVDPDSERKIHQALAEFRKGRTTLLVAHRLATVLEAGRIAVMEAGRIVDVGSHDQLMERCRLYRQLYQTALAAGDRHG